MSRPFLSWQEWLAVGLIVGWWAFALTPLIAALVLWGSHRRLSA